MDEFGPHDVRGARRAVALVSLCAALVLVVVTVVTSPGPTAATACAAVAVAVLGCGVGALTAGDRVGAVLCVTTPVLGAVGVAVLDVLTADASVAAQVFFFLPVLFAATQLRSRGAALVLLVCLVGHGVVCLVVLPPAQALADIVYVATVLVLITVLLGRAGHRQRLLVAALRQQAAIDPLTGLVTRRVLDEAASSALSSAGSVGGTSLLLVDVDRFKTVNDTWGHPVGDDALELVGRVLSACSHAGDVVARMGGDELALLLSDCPYEAAVARAQSIVDLVRSTPLLLPDGTAVSISVSVGVAHAPDHATDVRDLYATADVALYDAKRNGRGRVGRPVGVAAHA